MAQPIYKVFLLKPKEAWYQLSEEDRESHLAKDEESRKKVGGKVIVACNSGWSSDQWPYFGVEEFPDIEAVQKHSEELIKLNWFRYFESMSFLGTKWEPEMLRQMGQMDVSKHQ